jgi:hypothetical protein
VRSVKEECLSKLILFGESSLRRQGKGNSMLFPAPLGQSPRRSVRCRDRLGGLLRYLLPGRLNILAIRGVSDPANDLSIEFQKVYDSEINPRSPVAAVVAGRDSGPDGPQCHPTT